MSRPFWKLTVRSEFCAAHALRHYQGKCEHLHGHNYAVEVVVKGYTLSQNTELLMDFGDLKALLKQALEPLDHAYINDVPPFDAVNLFRELGALYLESDGTLSSRNGENVQRNGSRKGHPVRNVHGRGIMI
mgnify:CR=1 FL=1